MTPEARKEFRESLAVLCNARDIERGEVFAHAVSDALNDSDLDNLWDEGCYAYRLTAPGSPPPSVAMWIASAGYIPGTTDGERSTRALWEELGRVAIASRLEGLPALMASVGNLARAIADGALLALHAAAFEAPEPTFPRYPVGVAVWIYDHYWPGVVVSSVNRRIDVVLRDVDGTTSTLTFNLDSAEDRGYLRPCAFMALPDSSEDS